ncbi:MAG: hypothetical protein V1742_00420 [Pseudomonadota bacterium]
MSFHHEALVLDLHVHPKDLLPWPFRIAGRLLLGKSRPPFKGLSSFSPAGVVGLWPFYFRRRGRRDLSDFKAHVSYIKGLVGEDHLAVGTDAMGVPGVMKGYRGLTDAPGLTGAWEM